MSGIVIFPVKMTARAPRRTVLPSGRSAWFVHAIQKVADTQALIEVNDNCVGEGVRRAFLPQLGCR
jgi:hypothetical protein